MGSAVTRHQPSPPHHTSTERGGCGTDRERLRPTTAWGAGGFGDAHQPYARPRVVVTAPESPGAGREAASPPYGRSHSLPRRRAISEAPGAAASVEHWPHDC
ncbi:unnamed protein product [Urochloa humidicola]